MCELPASHVAAGIGCPEIADVADPRHSVAMTMTTALADTLAMVSEAASGARDPWWIIGSAAVVLHGRSIANVKDVDLMMSAADAEAFLKRAGERPSNGKPNDRFRSLVFGIWSEPPVPVEVMGSFSIATPEGWRDVSLATREAVTVQGRSVFIPSAEELVRLLRSFGRAKDLARADLLQG